LYEVAYLNINRTPSPVSIYEREILLDLAAQVDRANLPGRDLGEFVRARPGQEVQRTGQVIDKCGIADAKKPCYSIELEWRARTDIPPAYRESAAHGRFRHEKKAGETFREKFFRIKAALRSWSAYNLVNTGAVLVDVVAEFMPTSKGLAPWGPERRHKDKRSSILAIHALHTGNVYKTHLYSELLCYIVNTYGSPHPEARRLTHA